MPSRSFETIFSARAGICDGIAGIEFGERHVPGLHPVVVADHAVGPQHPVVRGGPSSPGGGLRVHGGGNREGTLRSPASDQTDRGGPRRDGGRPRLGARSFPGIRSRREQERARAQGPRGDERKVAHGMFFRSRRGGFSAPQDAPGQLMKDSGEPTPLQAEGTRSGVSGEGFSVTVTMREIRPWNTAFSSFSAPRIEAADRRRSWSMVVWFEYGQSHLLPG